MATVKPSLCSQVYALSFDHTQVKEDGTYPVVFSGSGDASFLGIRLPGSLFSMCQADGGDICISTTQDDTGQIPVEVVSINKATSQAELWAPIPLTTTAGGIVYLFFGSNSGTLTQPAAGATYGSQSVWDANYAGVWHFGTPSVLALTDSTANANNGTDTDGTATAGSGQYGGAINLLNSAGIDVGQGTSLDLTGSLTFSAWVNRTLANTLSSIIVKGTASHPYWWYLQNSNHKQAANYNNHTINGNSNSFSQSTWQRLAFTFNTSGTLGTFYLNGVAVGSGTAAGTPSPHGIDAIIGATFYGLLDDLHVQSTCRSANWLLTELAVQSSKALISIASLGTNINAGRIGLGMGLGI